jgi:type I restriction enzyme S subunit
MNSAWPVVRLGEYVELKTGFPFKSAEYEASEQAVRLLRGDNIGQGQLRWDDARRWPADRCDDLGEYHLREGDVVLAMDRPWIPAGLKFARVCAADCPALLVQRVARLRPLSGLTAKFLMCVVASPEFKQYIQNVTTGTAVPHISASQIREYKFKLPDIPAQTSCGELLMDLDDRIALLRETNATLETIAQALFKSWFVDFDPVRARQRGLMPAGMDEATAELFPDRFEDSVLGPIPRNWRVGSILDITNLLSGGTPKTDKPEFWGGGIPWASAKDVSQSSGSVLIGTERTITREGLVRSATRMIPALATAVVARGATTGRMVLLGTEMAMNQTCYALTSKVDTPVALYCLLRREIDALVNAAHGSVFDTITTSTFAKSMVIQPPPIVLKRFEEIARPIFDKIVEATLHAQTLATLRDTLLPRLISGQLRLPLAETVGAEVIHAD